ncbi:MAG: 4Fe-4S single cluster domain-containing protein [Bacillota bacterium]|nr:4Fe-4S single cluster domain-containing protein [Bacillota bacterium]
MAETLRLAGVVEESIVDGPGMRMVLFTQGCPHRCRGCHNPETHLRVGGEMHSVADLIRRYRAHGGLDGITFSGGEPFLQPGPLATLGAAIHAAGGSVISYSGFVYEALIEKAKSEPDTARLLATTDLLIDGPYIEALRSLELPCRGSSNQRLIPLSAVGEELLGQIEGGA